VRTEILPRCGYSAAEQKDRSFISFLSLSLSLLAPSLSLSPPFFLVYIARTGEPVSIRTGSMDLGPLLLFFSSLEEAMSSRSSLRMIAAGFILPPPLPSPHLSLSRSFSTYPRAFFTFLSFSFSIPFCFLSRLSFVFFSLDIFHDRLSLHPLIVAYRVRVCYYVPLVYMTPLVYRVHMCVYIYIYVCTYNTCVLRIADANVQEVALFTNLNFIDDVVIDFTRDLRSSRS